MRQGAALCLLVSCLVLFASCSFPGHVPETVKIGLSAPFEGLYRDLGYEALYAVRLAVREANEAGGIGDGRLVEMVALNDFNEPKEAGRQAGEMAVDPAIFGVIGGLSPRTAASAAPEYLSRGLSLVTPFPDPAGLGQDAARLAAAVLGARTAVVFHGEDAADREQAEGFSKAFSATGGLVLLVAQPGEGVGAAETLARLDPPPGAVFLAADTSRSAEWIAELRKFAYGGIIVGGPETGSRLTIELAGQASDGVYFASPFLVEVDGPGFASAYEALSGGAAPQGVAAWCYAAARRVLAAMDAALRNGAEPVRSGVGVALGDEPAGWPARLYVIRDGEWLPVGQSR